MANSTKVGPFRVAWNSQRADWLLDVPPSFSLHGKRQRITFKTKTEALQKARALQNDILAKLDTAIRKSARRNLKTGVTVSELASRWAAQEQQRVELGKKRSSSLEKNLYQLQNIVNFSGNTDIGKIGEHEIEQYQRHRLKQGRSEATINDEVATFLIALRWAAKQGWIEEAPAVEQLRVKRRVQWLPSVEEMAAVYKHISPTLQPLLRLLCETGCRRSEAFRLTWRNVDEVRGTITFEDTKTDASVRRVPISRELLDEIRNLPKTCEYVFEGKVKGKPIDNMRKALASAVVKAGITYQGEPANITPQTIRKAVVSWHAEAGTAESITQALCGHARGSRVTQTAYAQHSVEAVSRSIIQLPLEERIENKSPKNLATNGNTRQKSP